MLRPTSFAKCSGAARAAAPFSQRYLLSTIKSIATAWVARCASSTAHRNSEGQDNWICRIDRMMSYLILLIPPIQLSCPFFKDNT